MVLVHQPGRTGHFGWEQATGAVAPTLSLAENIRLYELAGQRGRTQPGRCHRAQHLAALRSRRRTPRSSASQTRPACPPTIRIASARERLFAGLRAGLEGSDLMTFMLETEILHLPFRDPFRIARTED